VLSTPAPHTRDQTPTLTNRWGDSSMALNGMKAIDYDGSMCRLCMELEFYRFSMVLHRQTCSNLQRFIAKDAWKEQKPPRQKKEATAHAFTDHRSTILFFSAILRFAFIRYRDCTLRQFGDAMHEIVRFNDELRRFHSVWLKIQ